MVVYKQQCSNGWHVSWYFNLCTFLFFSSSFDFPIRIIKTESKNINQIAQRMLGKEEYYIHVWWQKKEEERKYNKTKLWNKTMLLLIVVVRLLWLQLQLHAIKWLLDTQKMLHIKKTLFIFHLSLYFIPCALQRWPCRFAYSDFVCMYALFPERLVNTYINYELHGLHLIEISCEIENPSTKTFGWSSKPKPVRILFAKRICFHISIYSKNVFIKSAGVQLSLCALCAI